ncbi:uncharacterized protein LOC105840359 isoform X2 [Monomorium pharaonis]|nr:uncharacterized protein LOC105840359 isoform X2 [Monomorium pharaonis]
MIYVIIIMSAVIISKDSAAKQLDTVNSYSNFKQSTKRKNDETKTDETKKNDETKTDEKKNDENILTQTQFPITLNDIPVDILLNMQPNDLIALQDHIDAKFEQLRNELISQITSVKRSILYDLKRKITQVKHTIVTANQSIAPQPNIVVRIPWYKITYCDIK